MRKSTNYGRIKYVKSYIDAPSSARYILRKMEGGEYLFEEYLNNNTTSIILKEFDEILSPEKLKEVLIECRQIIVPSRAIIWVEKHPF